MVPFPKALVLLGSLADGVDDGAISLPLAALGSPSLLQLLGAVDLIVHVGFLGAARQRIAIVQLAANALVELLGCAAEKLSGFRIDRERVSALASPVFLDFILKILENLGAINAMLLRQGLGLTQQTQLGVRCLARLALEPI